MPTCIYCKTTTTGQEGRAHAIPEALCQNDYLLPPGAVCDACNQYLGKLDSALVLHEQIWLPIQVFGLPGKGGRPRAELGWMKRLDPTNPNKLTIEGRGRNHLYIDGNKIRIETVAVPGWNPSRFRRALYHFAMNYLALVDSPEAVLQPRFDDVRRYVRQPQCREAWLYGELRRSDKPLRRIDVERLLDVPGEVLGIGLFHTVFLVDLLAQGRALREWVPQRLHGARVV